ncbi:hypothetical protein TIFTF001_002861, partial [Ficus carica]
RSTWRWLWTRQRWW